MSPPFGAAVPSGAEVPDASAAYSRGVSVPRDGKAATMSASQEPVAEALRRLTERPPHETDAETTKQELYERAKELDIPRRSAMTKGELARAIARREG
jgi:hypothetical protein